MVISNDNESVFIGVDIGTTGVRACAYQLDGINLFYADEFYPLETPYPNWAEQNPELIYAKMKKAIKKVVQFLNYSHKTPLGIALSAPMHSFSIANNNKLISNFLTWADSRAYLCVKQFKQDEILAKKFYEKTCCPAHPCYPYFKMLWFRENYAHLYVNRIYSIKDYVFENLTGEWVIDKSCACASAFYNAHTLKWDSEILDSVGLHKDNLPLVVDTIYKTPIKDSMAIELGLNKDLPIVIGASDGVLVNLGIGAYKQGDISVTIGTSGAARMISYGAKCDDKKRTWCYNLLNDIWVVGGAINNGGIIMRWLRDNICHYSKNYLEHINIDAYELMTLKASKIKAGANGLLALPFFTGERAPHWNSELKGMFFGFSLQHSRSHMIRAVMEGICFGLKSIFNVLQGFEEPKTIKVSGSFTKSHLWVQILSDIFQRDVILPKNAEGAAYGAALLGFISLGIIHDFTQLNHFEYEKIYHAQEENIPIYQTLFDLYERLYYKLKDEFSLIHKLQEK